MDVVITARHFKPSPKLRAHVMEKFGRLSRYLPRDSEGIHITLISERNEKRVEAVAGSVRIKQESEDLMSAIELAADRLKERLAKDHDKRREHKGRMSVRGSSGGRATGRRITREPKLKREAHEMVEFEVDTAAKAFQKTKKPFMIFVSSETGQVNVLYRRKDGELGLIEAEPQD